MVSLDLGSFTTLQEFSVEIRTDLVFSELLLLNIFLRRALIAMAELCKAVGEALEGQG